MVGLTAIENLNTVAEQLHELPEVTHVVITAGRYDWGTDVITPRAVNTTTTVTGTETMRDRPTPGAML